MSAMDLLPGTPTAVILQGCLWQLDKRSASFSKMEMQLSPFLLCNFWYFNYATNSEADIGTITYMDADHIIFNEVELPAVEPGTVYLSSEKADVRTKSMGILTDYNTSFIRADVMTWKKVMHEWRKWYDLLEDQDVVRFREEIAFSCAAKQENIIIRQVRSELQSNFQVPNINCAMFHYGGDYPAAKKLKGLLGDL